MKRSGEGKPYLSVCLIVRNASETLEACLKSIRERAPDCELVIVDTCSSDSSPEIAQRYADVWEVYRGPAGDWDEKMFAFSDAAAARNRSFELCTGKWILWIDADDVLPGPEEAERLLKLNNRWNPGPAGRVKDSEKRSLIGLLHMVDEKFPQFQAFKCPYLYQSNPDGTAITWQERERIVRNNGKWTWQRPAHEILVPKDPKDYAHLHSLSHLLFVHKKSFTDEDRLFSLRRHFAILNAEYDSGLRHTQGLLYLENFSIFLCPQRRQEFIQAAYEAASHPLDRARVLIRAGNFASEQGFFWDAIESYSAATAMVQDFPDAWFAGASAFEQTGNHIRAAEWMMKGISCPTDCAVSDVTPRSQAIEYRVRAAILLQKGAKALTASNRQADAIIALENAVRLCREAVNHPAIGEDKVEAIFFANTFDNELSALKVADALKQTHAFLVANDETEKATLLLNVVPHNLQDHPVTIAMENWAKQVKTHLTDDEAYRKFYAEIGTDVTSIEAALDYKTTLSRIRWVTDWLRKNKPDAKVLEFGTFDGPCGIPLLRELPGVHYTAVETKKDALARFVERAEKYGVGDRLTAINGLLADDTRLTPGTFDVVIFYEVIEHVPNTVDAIRKLLTMLKPDGKLFLSTPWGAFDRGHSPPPYPRDPRGHVRAMSTFDFVAAVEEAGARVLELTGDNTASNYGDTQYLCAEKVHGSKEYRARVGGAAFYVPSALWDWNATYVEKTGIGASEETIIGLARHMGKLGRDVEVFGPLPSAGVLTLEEVRDGVKYWPREKLRHLNRQKTLVVSRAPSIGAVIDHPDKILWLQDAWYPDLTPEVAEKYRKIVVLTEWHKETMHKNHEVPLSKMEIIPNFLQAEHFQPLKPAARNTSKFVYSSSPDRGLINLLKIWPEIRKKIPDAELHIFYGWEGCMKLGATADPGWTDRYRKIRKQFLDLRYQSGIVERGRVNHETIALEMLSAGAWVYPSAFDETGCLNAAKSLAAGCVPVCTPRAALNETAASPITQFVSMPETMDPVSNGLGVENHPEWGAYVADFVDATVAAKNTSEEQRQEVAKKAIETFRIETVWPIWRELLKR